MYHLSFLLDRVCFEFKKREYWRCYLEPGFFLKVNQGPFSMSLNVFLPRYSNLPLCAGGVIYSDDYLVFSGHAISNCCKCWPIRHRNYVYCGWFSIHICWNLSKTCQTKWNKTRNHKVAAWEWCRTLWWMKRQTLSGQCHNHGWRLPVGGAQAGRLYCLVTTCESLLLFPLTGRGSEAQTGRSTCPGFTSGKPGLHLYLPDSKSRDLPL